MPKQSIVELRRENLKAKTPFCPGCGYEIFVNCFLRAIDDMGLSLEEFVFVSGIGCAGWITSECFKADVLHSLHGRPLNFARGIKSANPDLKVAVISGDGDLLNIGMSHSIHTALEDADIPVFLLNNFNYGMTGGQAGATTPCGAKTLTTPAGNPKKPVDIVKLLLGAEAKFVSRYPLAFPHQVIAGIKKILKMEGCFRVMEIVSPCTSRFGSNNDFLNAGEMLKWQKANYILKSEVEKTEEDNYGLLKDKIIYGEFADLEEYLRLKRRTE